MKAEGNLRVRCFISVSFYTFLMEETKRVLGEIKGNKNENGILMLKLILGRIKYRRQQ